MSDTLDIVRRILRDSLGVVDVELALTAQLDEDLGADEIDLVDIAMAIEEEWDVEVTFEAAQQLSTVADVVALAERLRGAKAAP